MDILNGRVDKADENGKRAVRSFVLRKGKLSQYQLDAVEKFSDRYVIPYKNGFIDYNDYFEKDQKLIIEIGFGNGTSTREMALRMSDRNFIGIEVFLNGFTKLLHQAGTDRIENLRLIRFDAVSVLNDMIRDESVDGFHIFFPDPWPKKRHHKRRLIQVPFAQLLARKLKKGGYIYCVTDWEEYAYQMVEVFDAVEQLNNPYGGFAEPASWRPVTVFEKKGLEKEYPINEIWVEKNRAGRSLPTQ
ncbi:MAG: tRNA (guanosine(46)-N7)-methyltransferase TrmB [Sphaerochaetaceae bacterium]